MTTDFSWLPFINWSWLSHLCHVWIGSISTFYDTSQEVQVIFTYFTVFHCCFLCVGCKTQWLSALNEELQVQRDFKYCLDKLQAWIKDYKLFQACSFSDKSNQGEFSIFFGLCKANSSFVQLFKLFQALSSFFMNFQALSSFKKLSNEFEVLLSKVLSSWCKTR